MVVDTALFQRMRHIKQLGICDRVYPGATHNRFFHSIGCAYLAHELCKILGWRQPELGMTDRDATCLTLAALCHDLGHPCYSHMFEVFVHQLGRDKRRHAEAAARARGESPQTLPEDSEIRRYEGWTHEAASIKLLQALFVELAEPLKDVGLTVDDEGDDFACITELIDPPKRQLEAAAEKKCLREEWPKLIKGRPVEKAWMYEIVSNWRSGIDIDKFDYFRRDALFLGIHRQFDHDRYVKAVKVIVHSHEDVPTLSPPFKHKDMIRENVLELRKMLHRCAYQHKTVKKLELHMIDILKMIDKAVLVKGTGGRKLSMSEAAVELDVTAYAKLTDTFIEAKLLAPEDPALEAAAAEYDRRLIRRVLMRLVGDWDLPRVGEEGLPFAAGPLPLPDPEVVIAGVRALYDRHAPSLMPNEPVRAVPAGELRCQVAAFHYGMSSRDPITRLLFHTKDDETKAIQADDDAKPLRQKIFVFWNPEAQESDTTTLKRLTFAFERWAEQQVEQHRLRSPGLVPSPEPTQDSGIPPLQPSVARTRSRRSLKIQASCPLTMSDGLAGLLER